MPRIGNTFHRSRTRYYRQEPRKRRFRASEQTTPGKSRRANIYGENLVISSHGNRAGKRETAKRGARNARARNIVPIIQIHRNGYNR